MQVVLIVLILSLLATGAAYRPARVKFTEVDKSWRLAKRTATTKIFAGGIDTANTGSILKDFLTDLEAVGSVRFVVVGSGAILETVGSFQNLRYADTPKGILATVSTDSPCFECHIRLAEVKEIKNVVVEKFGKELRITRFLDCSGVTLLSAILHADPADSYQLRASKW
jgi:putative heme degradation protein